MLGVCAVVLIGWALYAAQSVFAPLAFALFIMALVWPLQRRLQRDVPELLALALTMAMTILRKHNEIVRHSLFKNSGKEIKHTGDGIMATFDGPARAVRCADALRDAAANQGMSVRAGLHTGEIELRDTDVTGIAVVIAQRISALAAPNEILASRTVVDLTAGAGLEFESRGEHQLKGVPGTWPTFAAQTIP